MTPPPLHQPPLWLAWAIACCNAVLIYFATSQHWPHGWALLALVVVSLALCALEISVTRFAFFAPTKTLYPLWRWLFWHRLCSADRWRRGDIMRHRDGTWDWIDWQDIGWYALAVRSYRRNSPAHWWAKQVGKWRLSWDLCPSCNSDAPAIDTCPVCHGYTRLRGDPFPPDNNVKRRWWATFEDRVDCGYE